MNKNYIVRLADDERFADIQTLAQEIDAWSTDVNTTQRGVDWHMRIDDARHKRAPVYAKIRL